MSADEGIWKRFSDGSIRLFDVLLQESTTGAILDSLARIVGETLGVDRSLIFDVSFTEGEVRGLSEWLNPAHPEVAPSIATFPLALFRASRRFVQETHDIIVSQAASPHPTLVEDRSVPLIHGEMRIQSLLWYPFAFRKDGFYLLAFNHVVTAHEWTAPELEFMRTATRHVAMALVKKRLEDNVRSSLREKDILLHEIHHRVRNNLQMIISLLHLQLAVNGDERARDALLESENRVHAIALAHELLYESEDLASIDVAEYLQALARQVRYSLVEPPLAEVIVRATDVHLDIEVVVSCGLIVTELVANSLAYAFPEGRSGRIWVDVLRLGHEIVLEIRDDGIGMPRETPEGFGLHVVRALAHRLDGTMEIQRSPGTRIRVVFPVQAAAEPLPPTAEPVF